MSMPNIPDIDPNISISRDDAVNLIIASIGIEELSIAHLLNAEAEKIQFSLGTLHTSECAQSFATILNTNKSVNKTLRDVIKNQMLLCMKLEDVIEILDGYICPKPCPPTPTTSSTTTSTTSTTTTSTTCSETKSNSTTTCIPCPCEEDDLYLYEDNSELTNFNKKDKKKYKVTVNVREAN